MCRILMLGGTGVIGESIISVLGNDSRYDITVTTRQNRISKFENITYILGNANDLTFINTFEDDSYDVLIDFMNYRNENLERNIKKVIKIAKQYIFLSSSRVYDNSMDVIDESCTLLLDTTNDVEFRNSGTYAVKKAWQERYIKNFGANKITILRPYKTFSADRLQLGEYEIKHWLKRLINGKPIVLNKEILEKNTSLTCGVDVAKAIISLFNNPKAYGETFQIATDDYMTWGDVLKIYVKALRNKEINPIIYTSNNTEKIDALFECGYHMPYDIKFGRRFSSKKINEIQPITYKSMKQGLTEAISENLDRIDNTFETTEYDEVVDNFIKTERVVLLDI